MVAEESEAPPNTAVGTSQRDSEDEEKAVMALSWDLSWIQRNEHFQKHGIPALMGGAAILLSFVVTGNIRVFLSWFVWPIWRFVLTTVGTTVGFGLGLGLATHVYDQLEAMTIRQGRGTSTILATTSRGLQVPSNSRKINASSGISTGSSAAGNASGTASSWDNSYYDESTYASLMLTAGYDVSDHLLRGHAVRSTSKFFRMCYPFTDTPASDQFRCVRLMKEQWPTLPANVSTEVGKFMEHIIRDYVSSWYCFVDLGCVYEDEKIKREKQQERIKYMEENNIREEPTVFDPKQRTMVFSTALYRPIPMLNAIYHSMAIVAGNMCTRFEGVNVLSLLLIKWVKVLSHTFRVYRQLRKSALAKKQAAALVAGQKTQPAKKGRRATLVSSPSVSSALSPSTPTSTEPTTPTNNSSNDDATLGTSDSTPIPEPTKLAPVSEMAVTKEFLLKGKLHRAMTFGMDVPSLLFADIDGSECGVDYKKDDNGSTEKNKDLDEDEVLEARLFDAKILYECELDYNRVLGHRIMRALLPRAEFSSPIVRTMVTEMFAGCVLTPIMSCFCPDYMNDWILQACVQEETKEEDKDKEEKGQDDQVETIRKTEETKEKECETPKGGDPINDDKGASKKSAAADSEANSAAPDEEESTTTDVSPPEESKRGHLKSSDFFTSERTLVAIDDDEEGPVDESMVGAQNRMNEKKLGVDGDFAVNEEDGKNEQEPEEPLPTGDFILPLLTMSLIELQRYMDFEESRDARDRQEDLDINWGDANFQQAVTQLVLVIEAALIHGRRTSKLESKPNQPEPNSQDESEYDNEVADGVDGVEVTITERDEETLCKVLMEMTSDIDSFEDRIMGEEEGMDSSGPDPKARNKSALLKATPLELSTLRSLIAAWLHSGQGHRIVSVLMNAPNSMLKAFYFRHSFMRTDENAEGFVRQLRSLNGVEILVDTLSVLSAPSLDVNDDGGAIVPKPEVKTQAEPESAPPAALAAPAASDKTDGKQKKTGRLSRLIGGSTGQSSTSLMDEVDMTKEKMISLPSAYTQSSGTPRFLDFHRNENFATSLRTERARRVDSWKSATADPSGLRIVCRLKGSSDQEVAVHRELHQIARIFYAGTNIVTLRNGARRKEASSDKSKEDAEVIPLSLLTVEMACARRRLEVPDDDSSFLLRAQPRGLSSVGVHKDPRNHDQTFKSFAATYEEPAIRRGSNRYSGGKYIRRCMLRYYPSDKTAAILLATDTRYLDQRKERPGLYDKRKSSPPPALAGDFLAERHLCHKWIPKGATPRSGSILSSSIMETNDFNAVPRSGKALDFVYRVSLFEKPMVELSGRRFTVHDATLTGIHRTDGSILEMSDASLSAALLQIGGDWKVEGVGDGDDTKEKAAAPESVEQNTPRLIVRPSTVEMGNDGFPIVWMKYTRKQGDRHITEVRSYRTSYIRAALMVASARQDAQLQCLIKCVRAGSARSASKQRTEAYLQPTSKLLEYANSPEREKQSILLRDLKLGINHIDREQLRRNGLLSPRHPTVIVSLKATVEGAAQSKDSGISVTGMSNNTLYKIRCVAIVTIAEECVDDDELAPYRLEDGTIPEYFQEEWIVYRPYKDFQTLHKHLKTQVASSEQSASAGARLVGAATAAFTVGGSAGGNRRRKELIPSLGQASKAGALGVTKKAIQKRIGVLNGYLNYLLSPNHLLRRCTELLAFLGAYYPLPPEVRVGGELVNNKLDSLGRSLMHRKVYDDATKLSDALVEKLDGNSPRPRLSSMDRDDATVQTEASMESSMTANTAATSSQAQQVGSAVSPRSATNQSSRSDSTRTISTDSLQEEGGTKSRVKEIEMIPSIKAKIDEVPLSQVRNTLFELVRYQFDFDNASFFRNRMFATLKTMSFAVTSSSEFRKMLYESHIKYISSDAIAGWIKFGLDTMWPDGIFMEYSTPLTKQEQYDLAQRAKQELPKAFPDQLRSVLGQDIVQGGLDMLHEMLQNRVILKSMFYMMFDMLWLEAFPELQDILTGAVALESE